MTEVFYWLGVSVTILLGLAALFVSGSLVWWGLIYNRLYWIPFRKCQRRLSVAAWHSAKLVRKGEQEEALDGFYLDDWPVCERPFYLSYRFGREKRLFILLGTMTGRRVRVAKGRHP